MNIVKNKKLLALIVILILLALLPVVIFIQKQQTQTQSQAEQSTTLYFAPDTSQTPLQKAPQENFAFDIMVNPGQNLVTVVKIDLTFDPTKIAFNGNNAFVQNTSAFPATIEGPVYGSNKFSVTVSVGSDPTGALSTITKVGTLNLKALSTTGATPTQITFTNLSEVLSAAPTDQASENVLAGATPAQVTIISSTPTPTPDTGQYTITGRVFVDTNQDGKRGSGEDPVDKDYGYNISITKDSIPFQVIHNDNGNGQYALINAPAGTYTVTYTNPPSSGTTFPQGNPPSYTVTIGSAFCTITPVGGTGTCFSGNVSNLNFGIVPPPSPTPTLTPSPTPSPTRTPTPLPTNTPIPPTPTRTPSPTSLPPTNTPIPTSTPVPQGISVAFTAFLHGIGNAGDNKNPNDSSLSNKTPLHPTRNVLVEAFDASTNQKVAEASGTITYNPQAGSFQGGADFGTALSNGQYLLKTKSDQYLRNDFTGVQTLTGGSEPNSLPTITLVAGDVNGDNALDILDYNIILGCYSDLLPAKACDDTLKLRADIQDDGAVNQIDYNLFLRELSIQQGR